MGLYRELADLLARLPAVDGPDERRALIAFTGPAELGIYLDWQGSNVVFTGRLLAELSRRGLAALTAFVAALPNTPQVQHSVERRQALAEIGARLNALDEEGFRAEFPVPSPAGPEAAARSADPAMLAAALVNDVLGPYYKLGAEGLRSEAGEKAVALAEGLAREVEPALAADLAASALLSVFRQDPESGQVGLLGILKTRLAADPALAARLAAALGSATAREGDAMISLAGAGRRLGLANRDAVGAIAGHDVVYNIQQQSVQQQVESVGEGGVVAGTVTGGSGTLTVGGQHYHGDRVDTGGGAFFGSVRAGGNVIGGDQVGGDQITVSGDAYLGQSPGTGRPEGAATFQEVLDRIARRPPDPNIDAEEIRETVDRVREEVARGEAANAVKVERWLKQLVDLTPDVAALALRWLVNPATEAEAGIVAVAQRLQTRAG